MFVQVAPSQWIALETIARLEIKNANSIRTSVVIETKRGQKFFTDFDNAELESILQCGGVK